MATVAPLDLLSLDGPEQAILRALTRDPGQTMSHLATKLAQPLQELEQIVERMLAAGRLVEQLHNGHRVFAVRFGFQRRAVRNLPAGVADLLEQSAEQFLNDTPLTAGLSAAAQEALLALATRRRLVAEEIVAWQGRPIEFVAVLQRGLLKRVQLRENRTQRDAGYVRRREWIGLTETLAAPASPYTLTAAAESELLLWPADQFHAFAAEHPVLNSALNRWLAEAVVRCRQTKLGTTRRFWAVEALERGAGATTVAANLAALAAAGEKRRVLLWDVTGQDSGVRRLLGKATRHSNQTDIYVHPQGFHIYRTERSSDYPPSAQLDMLLARFQRRYVTVICDTGSGATGSDWSAQLRAQAETLLTVTGRSTAAGEAQDRWRTMQGRARPGQKRILTLNGATENEVVDGRFQLVLPLARAKPGDGARLIDGGPLHHAFREVYRRLTLNHAIAIFVPSTMDVNQDVDNSAQVRETLSFLGTVFGGATSSDAEGVWRSENSGLVTEQVTIVRTFVSRQMLETHLDDVIDFACRLKTSMKQEAVAVDVDNELILV